MAYKKRKQPNKNYEVPVKINDLSRYEYDMKSVRELLVRGNFSEFSISVSMPAKYILPPREDKKQHRGSRFIGHIVSYDGTTNKAVISISPKYTEIADKMNNLVLVPRVRFDKKGVAVYCTYFYCEDDSITEAEAETTEEESDTVED